MAVREFDGVDDRIALAIGSAGALPNGAYSIVTLVKPNTTLGAVLGLTVGDTQNHGALLINGVNLRTFTDVEDTQAFVGVTDAEWQILAVTKAAGASLPRYHRKKLGAGAWSHADGNATIPDHATAINRVNIGAVPSFGSLANFKAMWIATAAIFSSALSDAAIESIETTGTTQGLVALSALSVWDFNQASVTSVSDLVGSANQTAITGTTVAVGDDPVGWTFGVSAGGTGSDSLSGSSDVATGTRDELSGSSDVLSGPKDVL